MSLRTKLLLSFLLLALMPITLFGLTAYSAATTSLITVERDNLVTASGSVHRALAELQSTLEHNAQDDSDWDELHAAIVPQVAADPDTASFFKDNFDLAVPSSTSNTFNLQLLVVSDATNKMRYGFGPTADFLKTTGITFATVKDQTEASSAVIAIGSDIYIVAYNAIRTGAGEDPDGVLVFGRKLGQDDVNKIKDLTGYDVALYQTETPVATTQQTSVKPSLAGLRDADRGKESFDQTNSDIALSYSPIQDAKHNVIGTLVVWRPRTATAAAQNSINSTLAIAFAVGAILAVIIAVVLGNSITRPLLQMVDTADKIAAGDLTQRVVAPSKDELGRLASAFNAMTAKVAERVSVSESETSRLQELNEFRLNLLSSIVQMLKSPIANILSHTSTLTMSVYGDLNEPQDRSARSIARSAALASSLLADLIDFSSAQRHQLKISRERLSLNDVVQSVINSNKDRYQQKLLSITAQIPNDLPPIFADRTRMEQILGVLLNWLCTYSLPNSQVSIFASAGNGVVHISLTDSSSGLPADEIPKVFDLFYSPASSDSSANRLEIYQGLGPAFAQALVEQHGGTIKLTVTPNQGNMFSFDIGSTS